MITFTLTQAKSLLSYSASLFFLPLTLVGWFPGNPYVLSTSFIALGLMLVWRDKFAHKVLHSEFEYEQEDRSPAHLASSNTTDMAIGFHGSEH